MKTNGIKTTIISFLIIMLVCLGIGAAVKYKPHVNPLACVGCGDCVRICPVAGEAVYIVRGKAIINLEMCIGCGKCISICSYGAVK